MSRKLFIETALDRRLNNGSCTMSDVREATEEEIEKFKTSPCNHSSTELLIYDVPGHIYNFRLCAVCDDLLGMI